MVKSVFAYTLLAGMGVVVAFVGTSAHRAFPWWGVALAIVMVLAGAVFARTWRRWSGVAVFAIAWFLLTSAFVLEGPGGSILIVDDALGLSWMIGGSLAIVAASLVPRAVLMGSDSVPS